MTSDKAIADVLFGETAAPASPATSTAPAAAPSTPPPAPSSASPLERELYGKDYRPSPTETFATTTALREVFAQRREDLGNTLELASDAQVERHREFASIIRETGVDPYTFGADLYEAWTDAQLAERRGAVPDAARLAAAAEDLRAELRSAYGIQRAERIEAALGDFLQQRPRLLTLLQTPGIEATPKGKKALTALVDHVRRTRHI
jgi:hypothetical protein